MGVLARGASRGCYGPSLVPVLPQLPGGAQHPRRYGPAVYWDLHTTILRPFFRDHPGEPVPEENFWTLWCKGRLTEADTDHPAGRHSIRTNQCPLPPSSKNGEFFLFLCTVLVNRYVSAFLLLLTEDCNGMCTSGIAKCCTVAVTRNVWLCFRMYHLDTSINL